jgi:hypothetical protein
MLKRERETQTFIYTERNKRRSLKKQLGFEAQRTKHAESEKSVRDKQSNSNEVMNSPYRIFLAFRHTEIPKERRRKNNKSRRGDMSRLPH